MVDTGRLLELIPHYVAMILAWFLVLVVLQTVLGPENVGTVVEIAVLAVVAFSYQPVVRRLGIAPRMWERG